MKERLKLVKAFIFDWDGVFNSGAKDEKGSSNFNEVDSMGINLLRFSYRHSTGTMPKTAIISGERNSAAFHLSAREHYDACYFKIADKLKALDHFCQMHHLEYQEVAFVFDDVLDLPIARVCGVRMLINRSGPSLFREYILRHKLADYLTHAEPGHYGLREVCELIMGINHTFDKTLEGRISFSPEYAAYLSERNLISTAFYTLQDNGIVPQIPEG